MESTTTNTRVPWATPPVPASSSPASDHDTQTSVLIDGAASNLPDEGICLIGGRALQDGKGASPTKPSSSRIVRCKKRTIISTLNTRTLGPAGRLEELLECARSQNIDIQTVQEHRYYHPDVELKYHQAGSYQLVTSAATKNTTKSHCWMPNGKHSRKFEN